MKINITHKKETSGLISKTTSYVVYIEGQFTHEEMAIVAENSYERNKMFDRPLPIDGDNDKYENNPLLLHFNISHLMQGKPDRWPLRTAYEALGYENQAVQACQAFKEVLEISGAYAEGTKTFEI